MRLSVEAGVALVGAAVLAAAGCSDRLSTAQPPSVCSTVRNYVVGDTARDSLTAGDCTSDGAFVDYYSFDVGSQSQLRLSVSSPKTGIVLWLIDRRNAKIASSFYPSGIADTAATLRLMIDTGSYAIGVRAATAGGSGPYRMIATFDTLPVSGCGYEWVTPGVTTTQTITNSDCTGGPGGTSYLWHVYAIVLLQNQSISITETSTAFTPEMVLSSQVGTTQSQADTTPNTAFIQAIAASQGLYTLWVGGSGLNDVGQYTIKIE